MLRTGTTWFLGFVAGLILPSCYYYYRSPKSKVEPLLAYSHAGSRPIKAKVPRKPYLVVCTSPVTGHFTPILSLTSRLIEKGYKATFIAGDEFRAKVEAAGAEWVHTRPCLTPELLAERQFYPEGIPRLQYDMKNVFVGTTPHRWEVLKETLIRVRQENPNEEIVILTESFFLGHLPLIQGAPLPKGFNKRPGIINIHAATYMADSIDTAPFGEGLPPDYTDEGRARNLAIKENGFDDTWGAVLAYEEEINTSLGVKCPPGSLGRLPPLDRWVTLPDVTLQMCPESLEYYRSDVHPKIKFVGALGPRPVKGVKYPSWWSEVIRGDKKIVTVTQGTLSIDYTSLIIPTLEVMANKPDLLVIALLGARGATLGDYKVPENARILDYFSYDAILPFTDVFVMNAGYGGFIHGVTNGVPMVLAGASEDKPEVATRGEYAGVAVNLKTATPSKEQISDGVWQALNNGKFKHRVMEIKRENQELDALTSVEKYIHHYASF